MPHAGGSVCRLATIRGSTNAVIPFDTLFSILCAITLDFLGKVKFRGLIAISPKGSLARAQIELRANLSCLFLVWVLSGGNNARLLRGHKHLKPIVPTSGSLQRVEPEGPIDLLAGLRYEVITPRLSHSG